MPLRLPLTGDDVRVCAPAALAGGGLFRVRPKLSPAPSSGLLIGSKATVLALYDLIGRELELGTEPVGHLDHLGGAMPASAANIVH